MTRISGTTVAAAAAATGKHIQAQQVRSGEPTAATAAAASSC